MRQLDYLLSMRERHGDVFRIRSMGQPLLVVGDPELARQVFQAPTDVLLGGEGNDRVLGWLLGKSSLILLDGDRHVSHRRILLPPLHGRQLARHAETMRTLAGAQLDAWPLHEGMAALPRMRELTLDVVMCLLFGDGDTDEDVGPLRDALLVLLTPSSAPGDKAPASRESLRRAESLLADAVTRRRSDPRSSERDDIVSILLAASDENGSPLSDAEVRDELLTIVIAGTETTAGSLAWALERLVRAPDALARAAAEAPYGGGPFTDAVIYETLRMRPAIPMSGRFAKQPFQLGERTIDPGTVVVVSALLIHHRADLYPDPMAFRPERFLDRQPGTYTWLPFGGGVRRCIGASFSLLELRVVLSAVLERLTPRALDPAPEKLLSRANTLVPAHGARIAFEPAAPR